MSLKTELDTLAFVLKNACDEDLLEKLRERLTYFQQRDVFDWDYFHTHGGFRNITIRQVVMRNRLASELVFWLSRKARDFHDWCGLMEWKFRAGIYEE